MPATATPDAMGTGSLRVMRTGPRQGVRWARRLVILVAGAIFAVVLAGLPLYVFPPQGDATDADLVYVIGPARTPRLDLAQQLLADGATTALVSTSNEVYGDHFFAPSALAICEDADVTCGTPSPFTTNGEAAMLTDYVATHDVGKIVVITFTPHVARTRYIFATCYSGDVTVVGVDESLSLFDWVYQYAYQTAGFVKAWFTPCAGD